ncbi:hypothetical protein [uncultured Psychrobacter sp.]|uniref:hypothetical protein n=1 Tax=uncultured Psychrobacter sp. TaxID=259303 RepID=UPI0034599E25
MSTKPTASPDSPSPNRQRRQAHRLLVRLQWLLILLLIIALVWLYVSQQRFQNQTNDRLQNNEQVISRLNEMDDRLFAINQQASPKPNTAASNQAQNQLDLLRIQIQAADRLLADNNYSASIDLLRSLQWQLSQDSNEIAPALTTVIKQSLAKDIERLQAQSLQPNAWQLQNIAIQNIQEFLHSYEHINSTNKRSKDTNTAAIATTADNSVALMRRQLVVHEAIMTLNLAIQASNMREPEQLNDYLRQARDRLQTLIVNQATTQKTPASTVQSSLEDRIKASESEARLVTTAPPANIQEVIGWLDKLIANAPTSTPLVTTQILRQESLS